ncbi:MAG: hypothetical protein ACYDCH_00495 [Gaiellaceae bacterium]
MARILVCEADADVRRLLVILLSRLGHEPVVVDPGDGDLPAGDLAIVEPAAPACLDLVRLARTRDPGLPVLCVSVLPQESDFRLLGRFAYLTKPFAVHELRDAVAGALAVRDDRLIA